MTRTTGHLTSCEADMGVRSTRRFAPGLLTRHAAYT